MLTIDELRRIVADDPAELARDVIDFNYVQLARKALLYIETLERFHRAEVDRLRAQRGIGGHVAILLAAARRDGRKTIRIDRLLDEAEKRCHG